MADLDAIRARLAAATPGPWHPDLLATQCDVRAASGRKIAICRDLSLPPMGRTYTEAHLREIGGNIEFIAAAPTDIADLLAEVERLRAALIAARENIAAVDGDPEQMDECPHCEGWAPRTSQFAKPYGPVEHTADCMWALGTAALAAAGGQS